MTITIPSVSAYSTGVLIALFERTVGLYASLININAYHQPGVEAGKKAAQAIINLQKKTLALLKSEKNNSLTASEIAKTIGYREAAEPIFKICKHLAANGRIAAASNGESPFETRYSIK
jgi:glucose-6-phosphate isomerase